MSRERPTLARLTQRTIADAVPGLAEQFRKRVPKSYLRRSGAAVKCTCGETTDLERPWCECAGGCGRWFMPTVDSVRAAGPYADA